MASPELDLVMKLLRSRPQVTGHDVAKMRGGLEAMTAGAALPPDVARAVGAVLADTGTTLSQILDKEHPDG